ncbi:MAG: DUF1826 domain-containing protein, partial [Sphingomonas sp.]
TLPDHAFRGEDADALEAILSPDVNLAIWARDRAPTLPTFGERDAAGDVTLTTDAAGAVGPVRAALLAADYPEAVARMLALDIAALAARLGDLLGRARVSIRLEVIETDACKRFHADYVGVRMICTYAGRGTQWLTQDDAARLADGAPIDALDVHDISTGHVALLKGRLRAPHRPIFHRSPPIAGTGRRRLVLVIDGAVDAPDSHD